MKWIAFCVLLILQAVRLSAEDYYEEGNKPKPHGRQSNAGNRPFRQRVQQQQQQRPFQVIPTTSPPFNPNPPGPDPNWEPNPPGPGPNRGNNPPAPGPWGNNPPGPGWPPGGSGSGFPPHVTETPRGPYGSTPSPNGQSGLNGPGGPFSGTGYNGPLPPFPPIPPPWWNRNNCHTSCSCSCAAPCNCGPIIIYKPYPIIVPPNGTHPTTPAPTTPHPTAGTYGDQIDPTGRWRWNPEHITARPNEYRWPWQVKKPNWELPAESVY